MIKPDDVALDAGGLEAAKVAKDAMYPLDGTEAAIRAYEAHTRPEPVAEIAELADALYWYDIRDDVNTIASVIRKARKLVAAIASPAKASEDGLCSDCPPVGYETNRTRCAPCPRGTGEASSAERMEELRERVHYAEGTADANIARANEAEASKRRMEEALRRISTELPYPEEAKEIADAALSDSPASATTIGDERIYPNEAFGSDASPTPAVTEAAPDGWKWQLVPDYPEGDVTGPCICGSWPGGKCLRCAPAQQKEPSR